MAKDKMDNPANISEEEIKKKLSSTQYKVMREAGTEPAFNNEYWNKKDDGIYVDALTGEALFSSLDKYDSGTGWPSFTKSIDDEVVTKHTDKSIPFMERTEVKSKGSGSHLGHVFNDGPGPTGERFCMNSASLRFISKEELMDPKNEKYAKYRKLFDQKKP